MKILNQSRGGETQDGVIGKRIKRCKQCVGRGGDHFEKERVDLDSELGWFRIAAIVSLLVWTALVFYSSIIYIILYAFICNLTIVN